MPYDNQLQEYQLKIFEKQAKDGAKPILRMSGSPRLFLPVNEPEGNYTLKCQLKKQQVGINGVVKEKFIKIKLTPQHKVVQLMQVVMEKQIKVKNNGLV